MFADIVLKSKTIYLGEGVDPIKGGIAIKGSKILCVGDTEEINSYIGENTDVRNVGDKLIMPGFIDAHQHFFFAAIYASSYMLNLFDTKSEQECGEKVKDFLEANPNYSRIVGTGWWPSNWEEVQYPSKKTLDEIDTDKPVYLICSDYHTMWLNTKAMEECGITEKTEVSFGSIGKDENGEITGILYDMEACGPAFDKAFNFPKEEKKEVLKNYLKLLSSHGITSTVDMSIKTIFSGDFQEYKILKELNEMEEISVRVHLYPSLGTSTDLTEAKKLREDYQGSVIRVSGLKQFFDGVTYTHTSYLLKPYTDMPTTCGKTFYSHRSYEECIEAAHKEGFDLRLHTIGDGAVRLALNCIEKSVKANGRKDLRNSIEHIETLDPIDLPRFSELNVVASVQPMHLVLNDNEKIERLGYDRAKYEYAFKSFEENGAVIAFGTDCPVVDFAPLPNLYVAITRCDLEGKPTGCNPEQKLSLEQALKAYTYGGAYSLKRENEIGRIKEGFLADIIVIDGKLFNEDLAKILERQVELTIMDGKIVFEK